MTRKRCHRRPVQPKPPRGLRPRFDESRLATIGIAHLSTLDDIARGGATVQTLWDLAECVFTWTRVAEVLGEGVPEMAPQLELAARVIERFGRTGRIAFTGPEYQLAQAGIAVMDALAQRTDVDTAQAAARWSDRHLASLVGKYRAASDAGRNVRGNLPPVAAQG